MISDSKTSHQTLQKARPINRLSAYYTTIIVIFSLLSSSFVIGQNKKTIDSLLNLATNEHSLKTKALLYSMVAEEYYYNVPDSAIKYCYAGMKYSTQLNDTSDLAYFHTFLGVLYKNIAEYDSAILHFNQSIELNKKDDFEKGVAANLNNMAQVLLLKGDYDKALNSFYSSLEIFEKYQDTLNIGELHSNIGGLLVKINEFDAAEEHFKISKRYYRLAKVKLQEAWILYDLGSLKMRTGLLDTAMTYFKEASKIWLKFHHKKGYASTMLRISEIFLKKKEYSRAERLLISTTTQYKEINNAYGIAESMLLLGRAQYLQKKFNAAVKNLRESINLANKVASSQLQMEAYFDLFNCYKALDIKDKALDAIEKYVQLKDTLFSQDKNKLLAEYQTKLNLINKETIIKQLEDSTQRQLLKNENMLLENRHKQTSIYLLVSGIFIVLAFLYLLYRRNKTNIRLNYELNESLKEREVLIREVHHRVKNNLQIISSLLNLQGEKADESNATEILKISQSRIEAMSMIHENLYKSARLSEIFFNEYVSNLCRYLETSFDLVEKKIVINQQIEEIKLEIDQIVPCGLIINELVTNSIKHAFINQEEKIIGINSQLINNFVKIQISDNGKGLPSSFDLKQSKSLGLRLAYGLAKQLKSELTLKNNKGLVASFEFKR